MRLLLVRHLWGVDLTRGFADLAPRWREAGYEALEAAPSFMPDRAALAGVCRDFGFRLIPQVYSNHFNHGGMVGEHLATLAQQLEGYQDFEPPFFNVHSGYDGWSESKGWIPIDERWNWKRTRESQRGYTFFVMQRLGSARHGRPTAGTNRTTWERITQADE